MKKKKEQSLKTWLIPRLRRLSFQWPPRAEAMKLARVARGKYLCNICKGIFGPKEIAMDHILPVVAVDDGFVDIGTYVESLFCKVDNYQCICRPCHDVKTTQEQELRNKLKKT